MRNNPFRWYIISLDDHTIRGANDETLVKSAIERFDVIVVDTDGGWDTWSDFQTIKKTKIEELTPEHLGLPS